MPLSAYSEARVPSSGISEMHGPQKVAQTFTIVSLWSANTLWSTLLPSRSVVEKLLSIPAVWAASEAAAASGLASGAAWPQAGEKQAEGGDEDNNFFHGVLLFMSRDGILYMLVCPYVKAANVNVVCINWKTGSRSLPRFSSARTLFLYG